MVCMMKEERKSQASHNWGGDSAECTDKIWHFYPSEDITGFLLKESKSSPDPLWRSGHQQSWLCLGKKKIKEWMICELEAEER